MKEFNLVARIQKINLDMIGCRQLFWHCGIVAGVSNTHYRLEYVYYDMPLGMHGYPENNMNKQHEPAIIHRESTFTRIHYFCFVPFLPQNTVAQGLGFIYIEKISFQAASLLQSNYSGSFEHFLSNNVWFL